MMPVEMLVMPEKKKKNNKRSEKTEKTLRVSEEVHEAVNVLVKFRGLASVDDLLIQFLSDVKVKAEIAVQKKIDDDAETARIKALKELGQ